MLDYNNIEVMCLQLITLRILLRLSAVKIHLYFTLLYMSVRIAVISNCMLFVNVRCLLMIIWVVICWNIYICISDYIQLALFVLLCCWQCWEQLKAVKMVCGLLSYLYFCNIWIKICITFYNDVFVISVLNQIWQTLVWPSCNCHYALMCVSVPLV